MSDHRTTDRRIDVLGQQIRVKVRSGTGVPLVLCNGIGLSLDALDPLVAHLDPGTTVLRFDAPGIGRSVDSPAPYGFPYLSMVLGRLLRDLQLVCQVDVLGFSWGGALAQQFAFQHPRRCRRLILVSTGTGAIMVPGNPRVLAKLAAPHPLPDQQQPRHDIPESGRRGYLHQLLAASVWTSIFALPLIRQDTLIITGAKDPVVPVMNARIMAGLLPNATVHLTDGGHMDLINDSAKVAPVIEAFRRASHPGQC
ncbi:alpha/beta fold hydrolase [Mycobacterium sp. CBMA293]|uniref:alpha/beta fold hydrolase n=1 Tax=unclassified Mycolicibacterium TaxID=2636767 RepID=UPI0012DE19F4|nr:MULTISPECIES: alpha/beta fold hydrolase [unclassified Mycolicibacterium]MUL49784.1 alpha/beta fold hydrolase [Mycolicibacterium sp. CBMA 360]MUL58552.1 alpha/beta fold hydrolase [Mycolicibacterium sp. CBMA 335]MUL74010.1 alpha/beta fold hydrolase [Mycolicibacterium sp. CBMA 311]MUL93435.1 alpha/beta fold hydrolase [Mycolicibacterium sp. CBMA 230]MUM04651.1 poly(3-hydroxyalkanoate) depolymerase [Mycolicibacterium sp. CBMA 213]